MPPTPQTVRVKQVEKKIKQVIRWMKIWEGPVPYPFQGLWSALTNTDTCSAGCQVGFQTLSPHLAELAFENPIASSLFWAAAFAQERINHALAFGSLSWWCLHSLSQIKTCSVSCCDQPYELVVNLMQVEEFCFRVHDCSLCSCELLALGGISLNSFHQQLSWLDCRPGCVLGSVIWRTLWEQVVYLLLLSESLL